MENKKDNNVIGLAVTVGFFAFLATGSFEGGLSGLAGFLLGFVAVIILYVLLAFLASRQEEQKQQPSLKIHIPKNASIKQTEDEDGITIRVLAPPAVAVPAGKDL